MRLRSLSHIININIKLGCARRLEERDARAVGILERRGNARLDELVLGGDMQTERAELEQEGRRWRMSVGMRMPRARGMGMVKRGGR